MKWDFPEPAFVLFGGPHLVAVMLTVLLSAAAVLGGRWLGPDHLWMRRWATGLAWVLLLSYPVKVFLIWWANIPAKDNLLPLHFCNWAAVMGFFALRFRQQLACELLYFWGLAATLQAVITPNLAFDFPHPGYFHFFMTHGGIVIGAFYVAFGAGCEPRRGAFWRAFLWAQLYLGVTLLLNGIFKMNYGFLCHKPENASLFDHLGSWPYYLGSLELLAFTLFALLNLPFLRRQGRLVPEGKPR